MTNLAAILDGFAQRVNGQQNVRGPLAKWEPAFYIEARDAGAMFQLVFGDSLIKEVRAVQAEPDDDALLLRADNAILEAIFSGRLNPLGAYSDGVLEVYGDQKDQIKLDVLCLLLWGA